MIDIIMKRILSWIAIVFFVMTILSSCKSSSFSLSKSLQKDFLIGTAMNSDQILETDQAADKVIKQHFNSVVAENCMKSQVIHPERDRFNFTQSDRFVAFGRKNHMAIIGHTLIWYAQLAPWFCYDNQHNLVSRDTLINRMRVHIYTVMRRYKGQIKGWDVVNEAFEDDGTYRKTVFYKILGEDYIPIAFRLAHEADPDAELYYNDYSLFKAAHYQAVLRLVQKLKGMGLRIDAVGMQGHYLMSGPTVAEVENALVALAASGVKVNITEFDLSVLPLPKEDIGANVDVNMGYQNKMNPYSKGLPQELSDKWNQRMLDFFKMFLRHKDVMQRVTMWGVNDLQTWRNDWPIRGRVDYPLLFDRNNQPKPVVREIIDLKK
jgi:endo-1,4-beta-xylanase